MAKINGWKSREEIETQKIKNEKNKKEREKFKGKSDLSQSELKELLIRIAKDFGYL